MNPLSASTVKPRARIPVICHKRVFNSFVTCEAVRHLLTSKSRESGVLPSSHLALLYQVLELSLRQDSVDKVDSRKVKDLDVLKTEAFQEPLVLRLPVGVLVGPERMGDAIERIDDGTSHVVHRVGLELVSRDVVGLVDASVDSRVSHRSVTAEVVDLGSHEPFLSLFTSGQHLLESLQVVLDGLVSTLGGDHSLTLVTHL